MKEIFTKKKWNSILISDGENFILNGVDGQTDGHLYVVSLLKRLFSSSDVSHSKNDQYLLIP